MLAYGKCKLRQHNVVQRTNIYYLLNYKLISFNELFRVTSWIMSETDKHNFYPKYEMDKCYVLYMCVYIRSINCKSYLTYFDIVQT